MTKSESRELLSVRKWSEREARIALAAWESSGLSLSAFARESGICDQRLRWWRERLSAQPAIPALLPVRIVRRAPSPAVTSAASGAVMEIALVTGRRVRVTPDFDDEAVARLVRVLEDGTC